MTLSDIIVNALKTTTREQLKSCTWTPFALLYTELVRAGDIKPLKDLDQETKERYWKETEGVKQEFYAKGKPVKRIWVVQALHVWDSIFSVKGEENKMGDTSPNFLAEV
jgi:RNA polymerase-interacting CarD/CdnL/TRCF family regulator